MNAKNPRMYSIVNISTGKEKTDRIPVKKVVMLGISANLNLVLNIWVYLWTVRNGVKGVIDTTSPLRMYMLS